MILRIRKWMILYLNFKWSCLSIYIGLDRIGLDWFRINWFGRLRAEGLNEMNQLWFIFLCVKMSIFHMEHMLKVHICKYMCVFKWMNDGKNLSWAISISYYYVWLRPHSSISWHCSFHRLTPIYRVTVHSLAVFFPLIKSVCMYECVKRNLDMALYTLNWDVSANWLTYAQRSQFRFIVLTLILTCNFIILIHFLL